MRPPVRHVLIVAGELLDGVTGSRLMFALPSWNDPLATMQRLPISASVPTRGASRPASGALVRGGPSRGADEGEAARRLQIGVGPCGYGVSTVLLLAIT